ncbi:MAG TPA: Mth938-like domain-containing protein [Usitatibacter sp.]|nr:Mth938-like domain-containing protein [Usitatibacter sp.]
MKIGEDRPEGRNAFTGYGPGWVEVNGARHHSSLVVSGERLVTDWPLASVDELAADHLASILELAPEIVLIGTGTKLRFPETARLAPLYQAGIGVEVMDTPAACRTFNILIGEGRRVLAAVIVEDLA